MKKIILLSSITVFCIILLSFTSGIASKKHKAKEKKAEPAVKVCTCATPSFTSVTSSGGYTTFTWTATPGAVCYSFGGYYHVGGGFSYCPTSNSQTIPTGSGGTVQVRAICAGNCSLASCSSGTSGPRTF